MSNALPSWMYQNPEKVLENKQERIIRKSCEGCSHLFAMEFDGEVLAGCEQGKKVWRRCKLYKLMETI